MSNLRVVTLAGTDSRGVTTRGWVGERKLMFNGYGLFCKMKRALWVDGGGNDSITMGMNLIL